MGNLNEGFGAIYAHYYANQDDPVGGPVWRENPLLEKHIRAFAKGGIPTLTTVGLLLNPEQQLQEQQLEEQNGHHFAAIYDNYFVAPARRYHDVQNTLGALDSDHDPLQPSPVKRAIQTYLQGFRSAGEVVGSMLS